MCRSGRGTIIRIAGVAAALVAGVGLLAGCSGSDPQAGGNGTGGATTGPDGGSPGATDGATGGGGSEGGGSGGGQGATACALVTADEATAALGAAVTNSVNAAEECLYEAGTNTVGISLTSSAYDAALANDLMSLPGVTKIDGVGDGALAINVEGMSQFHVWTKGKYLVLVVEKGGDIATVGRTMLDKALTRF
jgi:hypothetical protein